MLKAGHQIAIGIHDRILTFKINVRNWKLIWKYLKYKLYRFGIESIYIYVQL